MFTQREWINSPHLHTKAIFNLMNPSRYIKQKIRNYTILNNPNIYRPTSLPYVSGDGFRRLADHIFDETQSINPKKIKYQDIVFIRSDLIKIYFENYHQLIDNPYILLSHNSDDSVSQSDIKYIDKNIIHWFAMKLAAPTTDKISPLPSGLENARFRINGKVKNFKTILKKRENEPISLDKIFCSFNPNTNFKERQPLLEIAEKHVDINVKNYEDRLEYLDDLSTYKFNLCPEGNNYESHRIWESLLFECTPIVIDNTVNRNFFNMGVPLILIKNWDQIQSLKFKDFEKMNEINLGKNYQIYSHFDFWKSLINSKKQA